MKSIRLNEKVRVFKQWAEKTHPGITEDNDNGEWCFGTEFDEMYSSAVDTISTIPASDADEYMIDDMLYAIARDNESESIMDMLTEHSEWFSLLCRASIASPYTNAKWQFAKALAHHGSDDLKSMIYEFLDTGDEYTERMALQSLAYIDPVQAERYAGIFWDRNKYEHDKYQKIMVLHVLYMIRSELLEKYLDIAERSDSTALRTNAQQIRQSSGRSR